MFQDDLDLSDLHNPVTRKFVKPSGGGYRFFALPQQQVRQLKIWFCVDMHSSRFWTSVPVPEKNQFLVPVPFGSGHTKNHGDGSGQQGV